MLHLHSLSSHVAIRNPRLCSHHSLSSQDSIRTGSKYFEQKNFTSRPTSGSSFAPQSPGGGVPLPPKVFVRHSIYKGKAALTIEPRAPDFASLDVRLLEAFRGHSKFLRMVLCCFSLLLQQLFANMIGAESSDEGKVRKVLKVELLPDGSGHFFNLSVQNKLLNIDESIYIPITKAEYTVLVSAFNLAYDPSEELFGLEDNLQPRNVPSDAPRPRSWFGPNGQYIRELPCPSCRGRGYTPCTECGIERSRLDCSQCNGKGIRTCRRCLGDCVIWEESIDEQPWEKARSVSPLKVKEDDEVDNLEIKLDVRRKSKRVYQSPPPEVGLKISRSLKSLNARTGLFSKRMKIIHGDPLLHAQRVAAIKKAKGTAAARKRASESLKAFFRDPENRRKRSIAMKGVKFYCGNCGREGHRRYYCPEFQDSSIDRQFRCRLCGEKGHNRRTCSKSRSSESKSKVPRRHRCRICGQSGHNSRTCPQVTGVEFGAADGRKGITVSKSRTYSCRLCQEKGHNIRTCPSRNKYPIED